MHILSMDTYRLGGSDQLRSYAAAMGTSFDAVQSVGALAQALEEYSSKKLILIDTQGHASGDIAESAHLASFLSRHPETDVHLVMPAYMQAEDMDRTAKRFRSFLPSKLIFTKLDDASTPGALMAHSLRTALPLSFLGTGQAIPEDVEAASARKLVGLFLPDALLSAAESAA